LDSSLVGALSKFTVGQTRYVLSMLTQPISASLCVLVWLERVVDR